MARFNSPLVLAFASALVVACDQAPDATAPLSGPAVAAVPAEQAAGQSAVAERIGSFGGVFLDQAGRPTVYLTDLADGQKARGTLRQFAEANGSSESDIQLVKAAFSYKALNGWYERTWPEVLALEGAVFSDVDEANNRVLFGVDRAGLATAVAAVMRAHGVPQDAYAVKVVEPIRQLATLRDNVNPKVGGLQIHFGNYLCTLGFNASFGGVAAFITNSHCTNKQGGVEGTNYYQPTSTVNPTIIATEVADPSYFKGGVCPKGRACRYSDSSRANYKSGISFDLGGLASVTAGGSLTINGTHNITSEADGTRTPVAVGATVNKVGRTTGLSTGQVTNTCVNTGVQGSRIVQLCQTFVAANVNSGDSGSPVYSGSGSVTLVGILWGGGTNTYVFSPLKSIKDELGSFTAK
jgi:hypothetical protein